MATPLAQLKIDITLESDDLSFTLSGNSLSISGNKSKRTQFKPNLTALNNWLSTKLGCDIYLPREQKFKDKQALQLAVIFLDQQWGNTHNISKFLALVVFISFHKDKCSDDEGLELIKHLKNIIKHRYDYLTQQQQSLNAITANFGNAIEPLEPFNQDPELSVTIKSLQTCLIQLEKTHNHIISSLQRYRQENRCLMSKAKTAAYQLQQRQAECEQYQPLAKKILSLAMADDVEKIPALYCSKGVFDTTISYISLNEKDIDNLSMLYKVFNYTRKLIERSLNELSLINNHDQALYQAITHVPEPELFHEMNTKTSPIISTLINKELSETRKLTLITFMAKTVNYKGNENLNARCKTVIYESIDPLSYAVSCSKLNVVKILLAAGADPNQYHRSIIPLQLALDANSIDIVKVLLEHKADDKVKVKCHVYETSLRDNAKYKPCLEKAKLQLNITACLIVFRTAAPWNRTDSHLCLKILHHLFDNPETAKKTFNCIKTPSKFFITQTPLTKQTGTNIDAIYGHRIPDIQLKDTQCKH